VPQDAELHENRIEEESTETVPRKALVEEEVLLLAQEPLVEAAALEATSAQAEEKEPPELVAPGTEDPVEAVLVQDAQTLAGEETLLVALEPLGEAVALEAATAQAEEKAPSEQTEPAAKDPAEASLMQDEQTLAGEETLLVAEEPSAEAAELEAGSPQAEGETTPEGEATDAAPEEAEEPEIDDDRAWYVLHSYSGYENKVKLNLEHRIASMNMEDRIFQVIVPTEEEIEIRDGARRKTKKRVFPGYILVQMILDDDSWYVVRNTPGVTGFVKSGPRPSPLRPDEVDKILKRMARDAPKIKVAFREGEAVRIVSGPFADFVGTVDELLLDKGRVRVLVAFFGRETPVELDFVQVQKQ